MSLTENKDGTVTLSKARQMVCLEASWELEALAFTLSGLVPNRDECSVSHFAVRGIAGRLLQLSEVLSSGLCDTVAKTNDLVRTVQVKPFESLED